MQSILFLTGLCLILMVSCTQQKESPKPNIIIIMADDMGFSDIGCFGSEIATPNIDYLAEQGMRLTQMYNAARCCPTRASLLTGVYPHQAGMGDMVEGRMRMDNTPLPAYQGYLNDSLQTIAELLKQEGYTTMISGKWHVGDAPQYWPLKKGFDKSFSLINGASNYFNLKPWFDEDQEIIISLSGEKFHPGNDFYMTTAITDHALDFIRENESGDTPFFLYLSYTAPHWPLHALPKDISKFRGTYMMGWDSLRYQRFRRMKGMGILQENMAISERYPDAPKWIEMSEVQKDTFDLRMAVYAAMINRMDMGIGRIMNYLEQQHELDNTLIMFLSDNGATKASIHLATSFYADRSGPIGSANSFDSQGAGWANANNTPLRLFKTWSHEGGIASPFVAFWPERIPGGKLNHTQVAHVIDLLPTCLDAAGSTKKYDVEGQSILPQLSGQSADVERTLYWEHQGGKAIRRGKWKLVMNKNPDSDWRLYNMEKDRIEMDDLTNKYPEKADELKTMWHDWADRVGVEPWDSLKLVRSL